MKSRIFFSAIALVAGLLLFVGITGFWRLTTQSPRVLMEIGGQQIPTTAQFVPRQAPVMVSLLARPDRLWALRQLQTPLGKRFRAQREWQSLKATLTDLVGWDYDADVRPWLNQEVAIAVTAADIDYDDSNGQQAGYLAILSCRDGQKAREALHLLWQQRAISGRALTFETISGIPLIHDQAPMSSAPSSLNVVAPVVDQSTAPTGTLASTIVSDRYVLLANHPEVIRQAIATFQAPDVSLARTPTYRASLKTLPPNRLGWLYANTPTLVNWLGLEEPSRTKSLADGGRRAHHLFMSFQATPFGLQGGATLTAAPGTAFAVSDVGTQPPLAILDLLPADPLFVVSGRNLSRFLLEAGESVGRYDVVRRSLETFSASIALPVDINSTQLWSSVEGEYALGLVADDKPTWILATQVGTENPFEPIDDLATQQGLDVNVIRLGERDIVAWTRLSLTPAASSSPANLTIQVVGVHTQINGYEVFSTSLLGLQQVLSTQDEPSLSEQPFFVELKDKLEKSHNSFTYLDWPRLSPIMLNNFPWLRVIEQVGQPLTAHLGPIYVGGYGGSQSLQEGGVVVQLLENS